MRTTQSAHCRPVRAIVGITPRKRLALDATQRCGVSVSAGCTSTYVAPDFSRFIGVANGQFASTVHSRWASHVRCPHVCPGDGSKRHRSSGAGAPTSVCDCSGGLSLADGAGVLQELHCLCLDRRCECLSRLDDLGLVSVDWLGCQWQSSNTASHDCYTAWSHSPRTLMASRRPSVWHVDACQIAMPHDAAGCLLPRLSFPRNLSGRRYSSNSGTLQPVVPLFTSSRGCF